MFRCVRNFLMPLILDRLLALIFDDSICQGSNLVEAKARKTAGYGKPEAQIDPLRCAESTIY